MVSGAASPLCSYYRGAGAPLLLQLVWPKQEVQLLPVRRSAGPSNCHPMVGPLELCSRPELW